MRYDDHDLSCPMCSTGLPAAALCDCDTDPMCVRCHRVYHVEIRWTDDTLGDELLRRALSTWGDGKIA